MPDEIRQMISADRLEKAIEKLISSMSGTDKDLPNQALTNELTVLQATLAKNQRDSRRGLISTQEENRTRRRICYALLEILNEMKDHNRIGEDAITGSDAPNVFISYNHGDREVADKLKRALEKEGIGVRIDHAVMSAGENIQGFIESSIRETDITLSIISNRSLLSAWVALESIHTFYHEKFASDKKFIACYVDDDFFRTDFRLNSTKQIDAKIDEIDRLILKYMAQKIDTNDLNNQKSRLFKLRNNLGDILLRLKESLCVDIRGDRFDEGVTRIIGSIR
jgi:hypothetical protein